MLERLDQRRALRVEPRRRDRQAVAAAGDERPSHPLVRQDAHLHAPGIEEQRVAREVVVPEAAVHRQEGVRDGAAALVDQRDVRQAGLAGHRRREVHVEAQQVLGDGVAGGRDPHHARLGRRRLAAGERDGGRQRARPVAAEAPEIDADVVAAAGLEGKGRREAHAAVGHAVAPGHGRRRGLGVGGLDADLEQRLPDGGGRVVLQRGALVVGQADEIDRRARLPGRRDERDGERFAAAPPGGRPRTARRRRAPPRRRGRRHGLGRVRSAARADYGSGMSATAAGSSAATRPVSAFVRTATLSAPTRSRCSTPLSSASVSNGTPAVPSATLACDAAGGGERRRRDLHHAAAGVRHQQVVLAAAAVDDHVDRAIAAAELGDRGAAHLGARRRGQAGHRERDQRRAEIAGDDLLRPADRCTARTRRPASASPPRRGCRGRSRRWCRDRPARTDTSPRAASRRTPRSTGRPRSAGRCRRPCR